MADKETVRASALQHSVRAFFVTLEHEYPNRLTSKFGPQHQSIFEEACRYAANAWLQINPQVSLQDLALASLRSTLTAVVESTEKDDTASTRQAAFKALAKGDLSSMTTTLHNILSNGGFSQATLLKTLDAFALVRQAFPPNQEILAEEAAVPGP